MKRSIRTQILTWLLILLVPFYVAIGAVFIRDLAERKELVVTGRVQTAQVLAGATEVFIRGEIGAMRVAADSFSSGADSGGGLDRLLDLSGRFEAVGIVSPTGSLRIERPGGSRAELVEVSAADLQPIREGGDFAVTDVRRVDGDFGFNILVPISEGNIGRGVLSGFVTEETLSQVLLVQIGEAGNIGIIDRTGRALILSHISDPTFEQRDRGNIPSIQGALDGAPTPNDGFRDPIDGVDRIGGSAPIRPFGWAANVFQPESEALQEARRVAVVDFILLSLLGLFGAVVVWLASTKLVRPIEALGRASRKVARGEFEKVDINTGDELQSLAEAFNLMGERVQETIESERRVADLMRDSLMPRNMPAAPWIEIGVAQGAATEQYRVGGDFYSIFKLSDSRLGFVIGDVTGKGTEAAASAVRARYVVGTMLLQGFGPAEALSRLNDDVCIHAGEEEAGVPRFVTAIAGIVDAQSAQIVYANAGHPFPVICHGNFCRLASRHGMIAGVMPGVGYEEHIEDFPEDATMILITDGVVEARSLSEGAELYGEERLGGKVMELIGESPQDISDDIFGTVLEFAGGKLTDDTVVITMRHIREAEGEQGAA